MKKLKLIISTIVLAMVICVPFVLTGCVKHYKVNITITEGLGNVVAHDNFTPTTKPLLGDNDVEALGNFEYTVVPNTHYAIKTITVNDEQIYNAEWTNNKYIPDENGIIRPCITEVSANYSIKIAFEVKSYSLTFYYNENAGEDVEPEYKQLMVGAEGDLSAYAITEKYGWAITIDGISTFGFMRYITDKHTQVRSLQPIELSSDKFIFISNTALYTNKSLTELKALLNLD